MIKRVVILSLVAIMLTSAIAGVRAESSVPAGHWLYFAFADLAKSGLLTDYPWDLVGQGRELTRYEMAYYLRNLVDMLDSSSPKPAVTPTQVGIIRQSIAELRRELLALGVSETRLAGVELLSAKTAEPESSSGLSFAGAADEGDFLADVDIPGTFGYLMPVSYGLSESLDVQRSFVLSTTPFLPLQCIGLDIDWLLEWTGPMLTEIAAGDASDPDASESTLLPIVVPLDYSGFGNYGGSIPKASLSPLGNSVAWTLSSRDLFSYGIVPAAVLWYGPNAPTEGMVEGVDGHAEKGPNQSRLFSPASVGSGQYLVDLSVPLGQFLIDVRSMGLPPGSGDTLDLYGLLGLRARYDYTALGVLTGDFTPGTANVSLESRLVIGEHATLYGGYGYTAVRYSVADQFSLTHAVTSAGVTVRITPSLSVFAEYQVLAPSLPQQQSQAFVGLSYSDCGSLLFGYRLLYLGDAQVLTSFSFRF